MTINLNLLILMCIFIGSSYPCGHCYECLSKIRNDWSIRLQEEFKNSSSAYHCILTYDDEHLPFSKNGLATVYKPDFIKFMKRLRHKFDSKIKYFAVSEYGGFTQRPHYHVIFFNLPVFDDVVRFESYNISEKLRSIISEAWQNGEVRKRSAYIETTAQIHYVLKDLYNWYEPNDLFDVYMKLTRDKSKSRELRNFKRNTFDPFIRSGNDDDRNPNFRLMSKNLGIAGIDKLKIYVRDSEELDFYMSWYSPYIQNKYPNSFKNDFLTRQRELYSKLDYDSKGRIILPIELRGNRDFYETLLVERDSNRKTHYKTVRYALPKYYRQKLYSRGLREILYHNSAIDRYEKIENYRLKYQDYDFNHDTPMYIEIAKLKWKLHASKHKDLLTKKLINNEYF